ncbi:Diacylglycerol Kinase Delta [Manis pentadactyla]|nr:Diacylglycerol Kinase Delta [Manis pentadactyla]
MKGGQGNVLPWTEPSEAAWKKPLQEGNKDTEAGSAQSQTEEGFLLGVAETPLQRLLRSCVTEGTGGQGQAQGVREASSNSPERGLMEPIPKGYRKKPLEQGDKMSF